MNDSTGPRGISLTEQQARDFAETGWWKELPADAIVAFQLYESRLCMDFHDFHGAVEESLGRPVFTHEFALNYDGLVAEFECKAERPTMAEIVNMIPIEKRLVISPEVLS